MKKKKVDDSCAYRRVLKRVVKAGELKRQQKSDSCAYKRVVVYAHESWDID